MAKEKTVFFCSECGFETPRWQGRCPSCGEWNTLTESTVVSGGPSASHRINRDPKKVNSARNRVVRLTDIGITSETRIATGMGELDRVLGGGAVSGSLVLVGGEPGIGKSTLLLQICRDLCKNHKVLYVSGEESHRQLKLRADRLNLHSGNLLIYSETSMDDIIEAVHSESPEIVIIDSIQTTYNPSITAAPGSVSQVKECTLILMDLAKSEGVTVFLVGHINKEGALAGPKILEHMVDCVLYFEGDRNFSHRILRANKNRFGSTNEIGVFEMRNDGLREIPNPSEMLLAGRPSNVSGSCVACVMEGTRPVLAEVQALVTPTAYAAPRRMASGIDYNRAMLLLAVLEKRAGRVVSNCDAYINVVGGLRITEPAADLPVILSIASAISDKPIGDRVAAFGEVGLAGELRNVTAAELRLAEIRRLGFERCILPRRGTSDLR
ncbi:MAG: DNA repair protein RadA, partial [Clostridiales bacterium]|nr:DNA repair protein RadA [Clostridiales bacterium]